jgi:hypothetical protein
MCLDYVIRGAVIFRGDRDITPEDCLPVPLGVLRYSSNFIHQGAEL